MVTPILFRRKFQDPVVEYYFLPGLPDIRLTVRFGDVLVHREQLLDGNRSWEPEPFRFASLSAAEKYALSLVQKELASDRSACSSAPIPVVRETAVKYLAA